MLETVAPLALIKKKNYKNIVRAALVPAVICVGRVSGSYGSLRPHTLVAGSDEHELRNWGEYQALTGA